MTKLLEILIKSFIVLVIVTVVGQIPVRRINLEHRYHRVVNSAGFQDAYWNLVRPVTWSWQKSQEVVRNLRERNSSAAR